MREVTSRTFANGRVFALKTEDGYPVEVTDTYLPYYTKDAIGRKQNMLTDHDFGNRTHRWMVGVSCMSGCPIGCKFCSTGQLKRWRNLTAEEIVEQVEFIISKNREYDPDEAAEFKINYTRMGEPFLNLTEIRRAIEIIDSRYEGVHHYISTIGLRGADFSWVKDNITLQLSLHSLDEERRHDLIPIPNLMSIKELGQVRTKSNLKTTVNMTLVDFADFDGAKLKEYFDPKYFFIKLSPINVNSVSESNGMGAGIVDGLNIA